jgi:NTP pyrophosphatase (non-canonical NTP hydrolase)
MQITDVQENARLLSDKHGWHTEPLSVRLNYVKSELEEVLVEVNKLVIENDPVKIEETKVKLGHEIFDLVWNLCDLANRFGIDLKQSFEEKININTDREFSKLPKRGVVNLDQNH